MTMRREFLIVLFVLALGTAMAVLNRAYAQERTLALSVEESEVGYPFALSAHEATDLQPSLLLQVAEATAGDITYGAEMERLINQYRVDLGLAPLKVHAQLRQASAVHNAFMVSIQQLCHTCPGGPSVGNQIFNAGYTGAWAWGQISALNYENPPEMLGGWQQSEGHNRAMINPSYQHIGCAFVNDPWAYLFTCDLAAGGQDAPTGAPLPPTPEPTPTPVPTMTATPQPTATRWLPPTRTPLPTARLTPPPVLPATQTALAPWLPPTRTLIPSPTARTCEWRWQWGRGWVCR